MNIVPWFIGTVGLVCLSATVGFLIGVAWGINFATAKSLRDEAPKPDDTLLTPQFWSPERMARAASMASPAPKDPTSYPQTYNGPTERVPHIPGLDDGL